VTAPVALIEADRTCVTVPELATAPVAATAAERLKMVQKVPAAVTAPVASIDAERSCSVTETSLRRTPDPSSSR
jgi:hypothetical protein